MKRFLIASLIVMNVALACSNEPVIGPVEAALEDVLALISGDDGNALDVGSDGLLYVEVSEPNPDELLSADSANALHVGSDGLLYAAVLAGGGGGEGPRGPEGPAGPEGPRGAEGPQGPPGTSVKIVGSVGQANQLPNNAEPGDGWLVNGDLWVWSGDGWNNVGQIQGPPGERGPEGPQGQRGPEGARGEGGQRGDDGAPGKDGADGKDGAPGKDGVDGKDAEPVAATELISEGEGDMLNALRVSGHDGLLFVRRPPEIQVKNILAYGDNGVSRQMRLPGTRLLDIVFTCLIAKGEVWDDQIAVWHELHSVPGGSCTAEQIGDEVHFHLTGNLPPENDPTRFRVNVITVQETYRQGPLP